MPKFTEQWGKDTAKSRYAEPKTFSQPPADSNKPQCPEDKQAPGYDNDTSGWVDGKGKDPHFRPGP